MPNRNQVLTAVNAACQECHLEPAGSLLDKRTTDGGVPCISFAGALLEKVPGGAKAESVQTGANDPGSGTPEETFFYVSIMGKPSDLNHAFCVYFVDHSAIVIQTWLNRTVSLLRWVPLSTFIAAWGQLRGNHCADAYGALFGVEIGEFQKDTIWVARVAA